MPKFERLTFPPVPPGARLVRIVPPVGRISHRTAARFANPGQLGLPAAPD
ncbi:hypothetical protein [Actinoplanes sp. DH11]|nr:hypothetical protein [Actinoplanes sp. DH11]